MMPLQSRKHSLSVILWGTMLDSLFDRHLWRLLLPQRQLAGELVVLVGTTLSMAALESVSAAALGPFVALLTSADTFTQSRLGQALASLTGRYDRSGLTFCAAAAIIVLFVLKTIVTLLQGWLNQRYSQDYHKSLASRLLRGYLAMPYEFHTQNNSAILIRNVTTETRLVVDHMVAQGINIVSEAMVVVLLLATLVAVDPLISVAVIGFVGLVMVGLRKFGRYYGGRYGAIRDQTQADLIKLTQSGLLGVREITIGGGIPYMMSRFDKIAHRYAGAVGIVNFLQMVPRISLETIAAVIVVAVVSLNVAQGNASTSLPKLAIFIAAGYRLLPSLNRIYSGGMMFHYALPVMRELAPSLLQALTRADEADVGTEEQKAENFAELRVDKLGYAYPGSDKRVISDLDLRLQRGEMLGLVGTSGAGKSTLINLLLGLLSPCEGTLSLNGRPVVERTDVKRLQATVAYVAQSVFVADDTLLANIALGVPPEKIDHARLRKALRVAQLDDVVEALPEGLETPIGERGSRLSGGQVQRVGIARALYLDRPVLVLDEATSALDPVTECKLIDALGSLGDEKTVVAISHRPAALAGCNRVLHLDDGRLTPVPSLEVQQVRPGT